MRPGHPLQTGCQTLYEVIEPFRRDEVSFIEVRTVDVPCGPGKHGLPSLTLTRRDEALLDINHESLIRQWRRLRNWANEEAEKLRIFKDLLGAAANWDRQGRAEHFLRSGG